MKTFVGAKIHGIRVTDKSVEYNGSVSVCQHLMAEAGMEPFERVDVVNLTTGARWTTYLLADERVGRFSLNGGGARLGEIGDQCVLMTWNEEEFFSGAQVVFCDESNQIRERMSYTNPTVLR
jgi:aspartate 1-decarboxylase